MPRGVNGSGHDVDDKRRATVHEEKGGAAGKQAWVCDPHIPVSRVTAAIQRGRGVRGRDALSLFPLPLVAVPPEHATSSGDMRRTRVALCENIANLRCLGKGGGSEERKVRRRDSKT